MNEADREVLAEGILQSLRMVIDPELGENVVDLGLIYGVSVAADGSAYVELTTTTRGCPATVYIKDAVQSAAWIVEGIHDVEIRLTYEPAWTPEMMNDDARRRLGLARTGAHA